VIAHSRRPLRSQVARIGKDRLQRFFDGIKQTGNWVTAANIAGIGQDALRELREEEVDFDRRVKKAVRQSLEQKSTALAVEGILEPVAADGRIARDDEGKPIAVRRYSDSLLLALLRAEDPERFALTTRTIHPPWLRWLAWVFLTVLAIWAIGDLALRVLVFATGRPHA
jgi:hypothetical protein